VPALPADPFAGWDAPSAAAALVGRDGVLSQAGEVGRVQRIASVSKLLTAYAFLVALEEGTADLEAPAGPPGSTLRHLLAHASGFGFDGATPIAPPGRTRIYSNTGIEAAVEHLEARTGIPFAVYLAEAVFAPLGLAGTELRGSPAHGIWSSVDDLTRFAAELLAPRLIDPSTLAMATSVQLPGLSGVLPDIGRMAPNDWGLGFELRGDKVPHWTGTRSSPGAFGHFGATGSFLWVDPPRALALVCLSGRAFGPWALEAWPALSDAVLGDPSPS
jgi:CubicO group peptidase (beta-lactamase class C family)